MEGTLISARLFQVESGIITKHRQPVVWAHCNRLETNKPLSYKRAAAATATVPRSSARCVRACANPNRNSSSSIRIIESLTSPLLPFAVSVGILLSIDFMNLSKICKPLLESETNVICRIITKSCTFAFITSAATTVALGFLCIPMLRKLKAYQIFRTEGPSSHFSKQGTPTMGGLFFVPVGVMVFGLMAHVSSVYTYGLAMVTLAFGAIGLLDDALVFLKRHNYGLPGWCKLCLQVAVGSWFYFWFESASLPTPFQLKTLVLLPSPFQHWNFGKFYLPWAAFCFASMSNGVNLTDGLDGLAAGTAAAAFLGMTLAVMPIYPAVGIFGVSMAGACIGFLVHNHYKAAVFMGDTGSLALGGALAAMAVCTGMFLPLFICSGVFFLETVSVIIQVLYRRYMKRTTGASRRFFKMAPIHHHFELSGVSEPTIVGTAYLISFCLAFVGGYVGVKACAVR